MKLSLRKLSQKGFITHHIIIPAVVVVVGIGGVGAYVLNKSNAASSHCALNNQVTFYVNTASPSNCPSGYNKSPQYDGSFGNFSSFSPSILDKLSAVDNNSARRVCLYNNSRLMTSIPPFSFKTYIGDAYNDRADYYRFTSTSTASCPSS
jgi:hypothetical protein